METTPIPFPPSPNPLLQPAVLAQAAQAVHQAQSAPASIPSPNAASAQVKPIGMPPVVAPQSPVQRPPVKDAGLPLAAGQHLPGSLPKAISPPAPQISTPKLDVGGTNIPPPAMPPSQMPNLGTSQPPNVHEESPITVAMARKALSGITPAGDKPAEPQMPQGSAPTIPPIHGDSPSVPAPRGTYEGDLNARGHVLQNGPGVDSLYSKVRDSDFGQAHPLAGKLLGGLAEVGGKLGDIASNALPGIGRMIPGTTQHYNMELNRANTALGQDTTNDEKEAQSKLAGATQAHTEAETPEVAPNAAALRGEEGAKAWQDTHPQVELKPVDTASGIGMVPTKGQPIPPGQSVPISPVTGADGKQAMPYVKPPEPKGMEHVPGLMNGKLAYGNYHPDTGEYTNPDSGKLMPGFAPNPPPAAVGAVTFVAPDPNNPGGGKLIKVAPGGNVPAGSVNAAGLSGENVKNAQTLQGGAGDIDYAKTYLASGRYTGSGDEGLMEKFFDLAKPSSGFRMTQPQIDMLKQGRSWMDSLEAHLRHATTGTWFSDTQRQQIASTMESLESAKENAIPHKGGNASAASATISVQAPNGKSYTFKDQASADNFKREAGIK